MPVDEQLEFQVIGMCLRDNRNIDRAAEILASDHFSHPLAARAFDMILALQEEGEVDAQLLAAVMRTDPHFKDKKTGALEFFQNVIEVSPTITAMKGYAALVKDLSDRRAIIRLAEEIAHHAAQGPRDVTLEEILANYQDTVEQLAAGTPAGRRRQPVHAADAVSAMLRRIEEQATSDKPHGVTTGSERIDRIIGGIFPGKLYVGAGRPGHGKSILGTSWARAAAAHIPVRYLSGELDGDELAARTGADADFDRATAECRDPLQYGDFQHLKATAAEFERMAFAGQSLRNLDLEFIDAPFMTLEWIVATIRRMWRKKPGHMLFVIDHLQLVGLANARRGANRNEIQTIITMTLKALAKELGIAILLLCQLSRDVEKREDKHPQLADLREGGSVEQDADVVIGIMRPLVYARQKLQAARNEEQRTKAIDEYDKARDVVEMAALKNRGGADTEYEDYFIKPGSSALRDTSPDAVPSGESPTFWSKLAEDLKT